MRRFIAAGIKDDDVRELIDKFVASRGLIDPHGQVRRVARKFGLVAAAGELAIKLGVLPWNKGEAFEAAVYAFDLWLKYRGTSGSLDLKQTLERIQSLFEKSGDARFDIVRANDDMPDLIACRYPTVSAGRRATASLGVGTCCRKRSKRRFARDSTRRR